MIYKKRIVIFAGTTEGRLLAERLASSGVEVTACVATEYGEKLMPEQSCLAVHSGRMDAQEMEDFLQEKMPQLVVDATHPYAQVVSKTVKQVCEKLYLEYVRLLRSPGEYLPEDERIHVVERVEEAAALAEQLEGNIFLTTGSKELAVFVDTVSDFSRLYARVLSTAESFEICKKLGFEGKQLICMQGPFSKELNQAMYAQVDAKILVTKESGAVGGFSDKVQAALEAGMQCIVIKRPVEQGLSFAQVCGRLGVSISDERKDRQTDHSPSNEGQSNDVRTRVSVTSEKAHDCQNKCEKTGFFLLSLIGIGMGTPEQMTLEAQHVLEEAQVIFGARRMLLAVNDFPAQKVCEYRREQIIAYLSEHPQITNAAVVFSGDVGFYSGADAFGEKLDCGGRLWQVRRIAGLSSVNYFAAKLGVAWQDMRLCSVHGRDTDLVTQILQNKKVFSLLNGGEQLVEFAERLIRCGLGDISLSVGYDLGYDTEEIWRGTVREFWVRPVRKGICVALFENENVFRNTGIVADQGVEERNVLERSDLSGDFESAVQAAYVHQTTGNIPDAAFERGRVPLSKEEIRAVALSKLRLTRDAVCYDIGAGTGGMTMDLARYAPDGRVYAFEKKDEACELLLKNAEKFSAGNVQIIQGSAPEILTDFEPPTHAFIGGSSGRLREIVALLLKKNPTVRVVIDAITLETVGEANELLKTLPVKDVDIISVTAAKAKKAGSYQLMESMNPVYIFSFTGTGCDARIPENL